MTQPRSMCALVFAAQLVTLIHARIPLRPVTILEGFAADTHEACIFILMDVADANRAICKPEGFFPDHDLSVVRSSNVRYCSIQERRAGTCHARFNCEVLMDVNDCSKEQLSFAMASEYLLKCRYHSFAQSQTRVWIDPNLASDPSRAVAYCILSGNWNDITGTRWMESDERQYELQRVSAAALNVIEEHIGPDVTRCVDHFLRSSPGER